jgi:phage-related minor tail protein
VFNGPQTIGVGENGPEAVIPLNARGADFMTDVMAHTMGGKNVTTMGSGMTLYQTRVDRSTNFTGPITVQANDPAELINKLRARQRVMALGRPSLTGSAA